MLKIMMMTNYLILLKSYGRERCLPTKQVDGSLFASSIVKTCDQSNLIIKIFLLLYQ